MKTKSALIAVAVVTAIGLGAAYVSHAQAQGFMGDGTCWKNGGQGGPGFGRHMMGGRYGMGPMAMMMAGPDAGTWTESRVKEVSEGMIAMMGNDNLKVGTITTTTDGLITVEILTKDGSLVNKLAFSPEGGRPTPVK